MKKDAKNKEFRGIPLSIIAVLALLLGIAIFAYALYMKAKPRRVDAKVENCIYLSEEDALHER